MRIQLNTSKPPWNMQHVFVYGTLLKGQSNHSLLDGARFVGAAKTLEAGFRMWDLGRGYPGVSICSDKSTGYHIIGELYEVDEEGFARLDVLEGYRPGGDGMYDRSKIEVIMADGTPNQGWIYTYNGVPSNDEITNGSWRTRSSDENPLAFRPDYL